MKNRILNGGEHGLSKTFILSHARNSAVQPGILRRADDEIFLENRWFGWIDDLKNKRGK